MGVGYVVTSPAYRPLPLFKIWLTLLMKFSLDVAISATLSHACFCDIAPIKAIILDRPTTP
jgi:hypothetical protein